MEITEVTLTKEIAEELIDLSNLWEEENSCLGYVHNDESHLMNKRIFVAIEDNKIIGYLFGQKEKSKDQFIMDDDTLYFYVDELFVLKEYRNQGIGTRLFEYAEKVLSPEVEYFTLYTGTKDYKKILHFYIDEVGMSFRGAKLYKKTRKDEQ